MDFSALAFLIAAGAAAVLPFLIYRQRELQVRGRWILAGLRSATLILALLLLWNPQLPGRLAPQGSSDTWVLLDRSMSMSVSDNDPSWDEARDRAAMLAGSDARLATFGDRVQLVPRDSVIGIEPTAPSSRLAAALERAAEAGAQSIVVVSDMRVPDATAATAVLQRARATVRFEEVTSVGRNVGIGELLAPRGVEADAEVALDVVLLGEGRQEGDSLTVEFREDGRLVATQPAEMPAAGRQVRFRVVLPPPAREGRIRYVVTAVLDGDLFVEDNERIAHVEVGPEVRGVVLVSLRPTWEPRFLLPVLQQVTGLNARGYLRLADGRYLTVGDGAADRAPADEDDVRQALEEAALIVLHGVGANAPEWLAALATRSGRLLVLAHDGAGAGLGGVEVGIPQFGEWYAVPELAPSPLAADLVGAQFSGLPPLSGLLPLAQEGPSPPLSAQRDGSGEPEAVLAMVRENGRRRVVVLASGFWRWSFRDGPPREAYRRLWAAVSGWLLANEAIAGGPGVRPVETVVERGRPIRWVAPGMSGDTVQLSLQGEDAAVDQSIVIPADETFTTPPLPPGSYTFSVAAGDDPSGTGILDVERFTNELLIPSADLTQLAGEGAAGVIQAAAAGRPLRTHPAAYLILLVMLCTEWVGRRRMGLR